MNNTLEALKRYVFHGPSRGSALVWSGGRLVWFQWGCFGSVLHTGLITDVAVIAEQGSHSNKAFWCCHAGEEAPNGVKNYHLKGSCYN